MNRPRVFWGGVLVLLGTLFLLDNLGIIDINFWGLLWPILLIVLGTALLYGAFFDSTQSAKMKEAKHVVIPIAQARQYKLNIGHGAGRLRIEAGAAQGELVNGHFIGGLDYNLSQKADVLKLKMKPPQDGWTQVALPWNWVRWHGLDWLVKLSHEVPLSINVDVGANEVDLDLTYLHVVELQVNMGANATKISLPADAGYTDVKIDGGVTSVRLYVPEGVAARIKLNNALTSNNINRSRFPRVDDVYQSPDYDTAANKVDITVDMGLGSLTIS
jgi:hypothetical protein